MTPPINIKVPFKLESEADHRLLLFEQGMDVFDATIAIRDRAFEYCNSEIFQQIYREKGCPPYHEFYKPVLASDKIQADFTLGPGKTLRGRAKWQVQSWEVLEEMRGTLSKMPKQSKAKKWVDLKELFFHRVINLKCSASASICLLIYRSIIWDLMRIAGQSKTESERQEALLKLVAVDSSFLTAPFAGEIIRMAEVSEDTLFKFKLAQAVLPESFTIDGKTLQPRIFRQKAPYRKIPPLEQHRQRYALEILQSPGFKLKSWTDYAEFFKLYNHELGKRIDRPNHMNFSSFTNVNTIRDAFRRYGLSKEPAKAGRPLEKSKPNLPRSR